MKLNSSTHHINKPGTSDGHGEQSIYPESGDNESLIQMSSFVRNFSEGMVTEEDSELLNSVIADWLEGRLHEMYLNFQNVKWTKSAHF